MLVIVIGFIFNLLVLSTVVAEIYKWKDANGQSHFGSQCPHANCESVQVTPFQSSSPTPLAATRRNKSADKANEKDAPKKPLTQIKTRADKEFIIKQEQCFDSIADTLGEGRIDPNEPIEIAQPSTEQYRQIKHFLTQLPGLWHGTKVEQVCKGQKESPDKEDTNYRIDLDIEHDLKGSFTFKSLERGHHNITRQNYVKILTTKNKFHAGASKGLITSRAWAVAWLSVKRDQLIFLRQFRTQGPQGGSLQRMILRSFQYKQKKLNITEYEYTQDLLVRISKMTVKR